MKKIIFLTCLFVLFILPSKVLAEEVHIYLFYGNTCPVCENELEYLEELKKEYNNIKIHKFETYENQDNYEKMQQVKAMYNVTSSGVPFTVVGDKGIFGFSDSRKSRIENIIEKYSEEDYYDKVGVFLNLYDDEEIYDENTIESSSLDIESRENNTNDFVISFKLVVILISVIILVFVLIYPFILKKRR